MKTLDELEFQLQQITLLDERDGNTIQPLANLIASFSLEQKTSEVYFRCLYLQLRCYQYPPYGAAELQSACENLLIQIDNQYPLLKAKTQTLLGLAFAKQQQLQQAKTIYEHLVNDYANSVDIEFRRLAASAAASISELDKQDIWKLLDRYETVISRFWQDSDPFIRATVARMMYQKALTFFQLGDQYLAKKQIKDLCEYEPDSTSLAASWVEKAKKRLLL